MTKRFLTSVTIDGPIQCADPTAANMAATKGYVDGESGVTSNVNWVKQADGTLIQWYYQTVTDQAINSAYSTIFTGTRAFTFPQTFVGQPVVTVGTAKWGTSGSWGSAESVSTTGFTARLYDFFTRASGTSTAIGWIAVGRWR
jgi:hypothetical protein